MPIHRRIQLTWPASTRAAWQPTKPEFAATVNALSLGMPFGEPYIAHAVRTAAAELDDPELRSTVRSFLAQEGEHTKQHRIFNDLLTTAHPSLRRIERLLEWTFETMQRRCSDKFAIAYAAGFETTAFAAARWMTKHRRELFDGADPEPATLFLWHLAEEVEHKSVAHDVWAATGKSTLRYIGALAVLFLMLMFFIILGTMFQLVAWHRVWNPLAWFRVLKWGLSFAFEVMPLMAVSALPSHHPDQFVDPQWMTEWLTSYDSASHTIPRWDTPIDQLEPVGQLVT